MIQPIDIINSIREDEYSLGKDGRPKSGFEGHLKRTHRMAQQLSDGLYERSDHFIFELIQNAEDNTYASDAIPKIKFLLLENDPTNTLGSKGCLCVFNNEKGFFEDNIKAICDFNASTKKGKKSEGFIGEKGLGFKSVFMVSDSPHIYSNGYQFKFLRDDPVSTVGYVIPYWLEEVPEVVLRSKGIATSILLPLREKDDNYTFIKQQLENFSPETLLFLKTLKTIDIETPDKEKIIECEVESNVHTLSHVIDDKLFQNKFWVESKNIRVPDDIGEDKREDVDSSVITIAFPLDGITGNERFFAYLPTEETPGFPFHVNADFLLPSSRENILKNKKWNNWLLGEVASVVVSGIMSMLNEPKYRYLAYQYIPLEENLSTGSYFKSVCSNVQDALQTRLCVLDENNNLRLPKDCWFTSKEFRSLLGGEKPGFFDKAYIVHSKIDQYTKNLKAIGTNRLDQSHVKLIFQDNDWIATHDDDWLIRTYTCLQKLFDKDKSYLGFNIVRTDSGDFESPKHVYLPLTKSNAQIINKVPDIYRGDVRFIDNDLYKKIASYDDGEEILRKLALAEFSSTHYINSSLIPALNRDINTLDINNFKKAFEYCLNVLVESEEIVSELNLQEIPLLLHGGNLDARASVDDKEIITPVSWDKETGWQLVFQSEGDFDRLAVLDDYYVTLKDKGVKKYFSEIDVTEKPSAEEVQLAGYEIYEVFSENYCEYINSAYFRNYHIDSTVTKKLTTWLPPKALLNSKELRGKTKKAFIFWLNAIAIHNRQSIKRSKGSYYYYRPKSSFYDSALYHALLNTEWIKTTKGYHRPAQIFIKSETLNRIFGNKLPYLVDDLSEEVIDLLGINKDATEESLITLLNDFAQGAKIEKATLIAIYKYLDDYGNDYAEQFSDDSLIYLPVDGGKWYTSNEVIWNDASAAVGNIFGWLSSYYPDSLQEFFISKLGVKEDVDNEAYVDVWLNAQHQEKVNASSNENMLTLAIPSINRALVRNNEAWIERFVESAEIWTQDKEWLSADNVYVPDDRRLRSLFSDQLYYPWVPENLNHARMEPLYQALSIKGLTEAAEYSVSQNGAKADGENKYLTNHTLWLLCYAIDNFDRDNKGNFGLFLENGVIETLMAAKEIYIDSLIVDVDIDGYTAEIDDLAAFFDHGSRLLFINNSADREDVLDEIANEIARYLWGARFKSYRDTVRKLLAVKKPERYKRLRDNENWNLSRDYQKSITQLLDQLKGNAKDILKTGDNQPISNEDGNAADVERTQNDDMPKSFSSGSTRNGTSSDHNPPTDFGSGIPRVSEVDTNIPSNQSSGFNRGSGTNDVEHKHHGRKKLKSKKPRSENTASNINQARRSKLRSYVVSELCEPDIDLDKNNSAEQQEYRQMLGEKAELIVLEDLRAKGYEAKRMPVNNPGYDIEATNPETGEILYIEVKGDSYTWSDKGVGISKKQYIDASNKTGSYFLAVVDKLTSVPGAPIYIRDPVSYITEYRFDSGWIDLAHSIKTISNEKAGQSVLERMMQYTDDNDCQDLLKYCEAMAYPYPDIGTELQDEKGQIVLENIELLWENEKIIVFIDSNDLAEAEEYKGDWRIFLASDQEEIKNSLNEMIGEGIN